MCLHIQPIVDYICYFFFSHSPPSKKTEQIEETEEEEEVKEKENQWVNTSRPNSPTPKKRRKRVHFLDEIEEM